MRRIGLMGGSFNPIHNGHMALARAALTSGAVDEVIFLPTGNPPHKREGLADKLQRLRMVQLAVQGEGRMSVSREEIDRLGVIYTVDTLARLGEQMPNAELVYLIGADTLRVLDTWHDADRVITQCTFLVMMRSGEAEEDVLRDAEIWRGRGARIEMLHAELVDISSTEIRRRIAQGEEIASLVPPDVEAYIRTHRLYGA